MQTYLLIIILLSTIYSSEGWIRIQNKGGYVARFFIDYYAYSLPPNQYIAGIYVPVKTFARTLSTDNYPIGKTRVIDVPRNALTARVRAELFVFYPFFGWYWKEIFRQEFPPQAKICFDIWGTTVQPRWTSVNC